jgi:hypothetical protein
MTDYTYKSWMSIGETDDPNAIIQTYQAETAVTKGDPVYLSSDQSIPRLSRTGLHWNRSEKRS